MIRIYLTNLGKYNEGYLIGKWVTLPATDAEIEAVFEYIGINEEYEEYFITDWECDIDGLEIGEYSSLENLNEKADKLESLADYEAEIMEALLSEGYSFDDALEKIDDCIVWGGCEDMEDVARAYADETGLLESIPENLQNYFDFAAFGRDMDFEGTFVFIGRNCIEII